MSKPIVSVVIPTCNRNQEFLRAVVSVKNQTFKEIEIIAIDDSGNGFDRSIRSFLNDNNIVFLENEKNYGAAYSRNKGIEHSNGRYAAFLDDDDIWEPHKLEKQVNALESGSVGICYTGIICTSGRRERYIFHEPKFPDHYKSILVSNFIGTTSAVMIPMKILKEINGFDHTLPALQDYDLYIRILKKYPVFGIDEPLVVYSDIGQKKKISCNYGFYIKAAATLRQKYIYEPDVKLLNKSLNRIFFLKAFRSRYFLTAIMQKYLNCFFDRRGK